MSIVCRDQVAVIAPDLFEEAMGRVSDRANDVGDIVVEPAEEGQPPTPRSDDERMSVGDSTSTRGNASPPHTTGWGEPPESVRRP